MSHIYSGDVFERAVASKHLETRLVLNKKYQSTDFDTWLMEWLGPSPGETVLDVGCGTGAQTLPILAAVGPTGYVCSLDLAADSVAKLVERAGAGANLTAVTADMADLERVIAEEFPRKRFDLAQSSYALYYSPARLEVLDVMLRHLNPGGRLAVFTPNRPHGMVELARRVGPIPAEVDESLGFGQAVLEPYFRSRFWDVTVHFFHNVVRVTEVEDALTFYRATTYFRAEAEPAFRRLVEDAIAAAGFLEYEKNGYLIVGRRPLP